MRRVVYFVERLGDRIVIKYFAEIAKMENPDVELVSFEMFNHASVLDFYVGDWAPGLFTEHYGKKLLKGRGEFSRPLVEEILGIPRLERRPLNLFKYAPRKIRQYGIYPKLEVPDKWRTWLHNEFFAKVGLQQKHFDQPIVCFHILTDAPYSRSRNHSFPDWEECIKLLSKQDVTILRVGHWNSPALKYNHPNVFDLPQYKLTPSQSVSVISLCQIYVGGDTGMTHAASALGKKIVGVWGDITHMVKNRDVPNNIGPRDWDSGPYVPHEDRYMLRRTGGAQVVSPVFSAEQILTGINHFLEKL